LNLTPTVKNMLLPVPTEELKIISEDENASGSTKSEIKEEAKEFVRENIIDSLSISESDDVINKNSKNSKKENIRKISDESNNSLVIYKNIENRRKSPSKMLPQSKSEINKQIQVDDEIEFPIHNKIILDCDSNDKNLGLLLGRNEGTDIRTYHIDDGVNGSIVVKTRVIQSTEKLQAEKLFRKKHTFDENFENRSAADMHTFLWDNMEEYYKKEAKKAIQSASEPKVKYIL
jgi:hypothetical protein